MVELRRAVAPLAVPLERLVNNTDLPVPTEIRRYLRDVADHQATVSDHISYFDEALSGLVNAALAKISVQQNTDMRKISAWVAIAAVPTMLAGIWGMNFSAMPELDWRFGYPVALVIMTGVSVYLRMRFKRSGWL